MSPHSLITGPDRPDQIHLRILETTDLHVHVLPYDYYVDQPDQGVGLSLVATLIDQLRQGAANSLLMDNGDFLQGNPMGDYFAARRGVAPGSRHPMIAAMNLLGYDAGTLGNHDFNYGPDYLAGALADADYPVVSANITLNPPADPRQVRALTRPYIVLDRWLSDGTGQKHLVRIGVIGFLPPQTTTWDHRHLSGIAVTRDIVRAAEAWLPELRAAGADIVVALAHSGIGPASHTEGMENACIPLARVAGIDVLLTGHSHQVFPSPQFAVSPDIDPVGGTICGKPATMAGFWGSHVGVVDLVLAREAGQWRIARSASAALPISERRPDGTARALAVSKPEVLTCAARAHAETLAYVRHPVGDCGEQLHSYFALASDIPALRLVARAQSWHVREKLRGTAHQGLPVLSAASPFKAGGRAGPQHYTEVPVGTLLLRHIADLYIYPNTIRAIKLTGADLGSWLERAVGLFNQITPGSTDQMLVNPEFPTHNFDMLHGVTYAIDLSQPSRFDVTGGLVNPNACRIVGLRYLGCAVTPDASFVIATTDYRAYGGGDFPGADGSTVIYESLETNRDILLQYIRAYGAHDDGSVPAWRFQPMPGTSVLFDTSPNATACLAAAAGMSVEPAGDGPDGFKRFRLRL